MLIYTYSFRLISIKPPCNFVVTTRRGRKYSSTWNALISKRAQRNIVNVKCGLASYFFFLTLLHRHLNGLLTIAAAAATECVHAVSLFILSGSWHSKQASESNWFHRTQSGRCDRVADQPSPSYCGVSDIFRGLVCLVRVCLNNKQKLIFITLDLLHFIYEDFSRHLGSSS